MYWHQQIRITFHFSSMQKGQGHRKCISPSYSSHRVHGLLFSFKTVRIKIVQSVIFYTRKSLFEVKNMTLSFCHFVEFSSEFGTGIFVIFYLLLIWKFNLLYQGDKNNLCYLYMMNIYVKSQRFILKRRFYIPKGNIERIRRQTKRARKFRYLCLM